MASVSFRPSWVQKQGLADLVANGMHRRQRSHRFLEYDRNTAAANLPHLLAFGIQPGDVDALTGFGIVEQNLARAYVRVGRQNTHDSLRGHRLSGTRLSDQGDGLARPDAKRDIH
jgi:hypothetical protein